MHTATPWRIEGWEIVGADNSIICRAIPWDTSGTRDEDLDNLYLLRAAPELLEALQISLKAMQENIAYAMFKDEAALARGIEAARAAIAKATERK